MNSGSFIICLMLLTVLCLTGEERGRVVPSPTGTVPYYPHSHIIGSLRLADGFYTELETGDSVNRALDYYKTQMRRSGWSLGMECELTPDSNSPEENSILTFFKGNRGLVIGTSEPRHGGKTQLALFMGDIHE